MRQKKLLKKLKTNGKTTKRTGKFSRTKGHSFERWVAIQLRSVFPEARRHLEYQMGEALGRDIANTGEYRFQCKRGKKYCSIKAIKEIQICPIDGGIPVLVTKGDAEEPLAILPFSELLELLKRSAP